MTLYISNSSLGVLTSCPRRFMYQYTQPVRQDTMATLVGTAMHQGIQEWALSGDRDRAYTALLRAYPFDKWLEESSSSKAKRSITSCMTALDAAMDGISYSGLRLMDINGKPANELDFALTLSTPELKYPLCYTGSIDSIYLQADDSILVCDYKTTTRPVDLTAAMYRNSNQAVMYALILSAALGIKPTDIYYQYAIIEMTDKIPTFCMHAKPITDEAVSEAVATLKTMSLWISSMLDSHFFPKSSSSCINYNRLCSHYDRCTAGACILSADTDELLSRVCSEEPEYRYTYLGSDKTDYDLKGTLQI